MGTRVRLPTSTIQGQITAIILLCLVIVIAAGSSIERWVRQDNKIPNLEDIVEGVSAVASVLTYATPAERDMIIATANRGESPFALRPISYAERFTIWSPDENFFLRAIDWLFPPDNATIPYGGWRTFVDGKRIISSKVDADTLLVLEELPDNLIRNDALSFGSNYLVALVTLIILFSMFAVWAITLPLRRIAAAAMKADLSLGPALFEERGSVEIMALARALNAMQSRISAMVDARTRMLRGISHDLRTPLTRVRLRAEAVKDGEVRNALLIDIERIDRLLKESLSYLRDNHQSEKVERADLASVLQTVCNEFADTGHEITYRGPARLIASFKPLAITRAVTNLCDNATKFGATVDVALRIEHGIATIDVSDDGPGIPPEHRDRVLEPFYKVDAARSGVDAGFGLGLSIVTEIMQGHGGRLELLDRAPQGLTARLIMPLNP